MSAAEKHDVVVVGAGVAGSLIAKLLTKAGFKVLVLEAGPGSTSSLESYSGHVQTFYGAASKGAESAWPPQAFAPQPDPSDVLKPDGAAGYFVQKGPDRYGSTYTRTLGGSTLHWLGVSLRMLPQDFAMKTNFGVARDWPIGYAELEPYYRKAEYEFGVSANVADQCYHDVSFAAGYDYPMERVPLSYSDEKLAGWIQGAEIKVEGERFRPTIRSYPAARNSTPRGKYDPVTATFVQSNGDVFDSYQGGRCQGNTSCTPICPVQAKYNAGRTMLQADQSKVEVRTQAVASKINIDSTGAVESITYQRYDGTTHEPHEAIARVYVLAAHSVENARLMLASDLSDRNNLIGTGLMDHPALYAWGIAPGPVYPFRGPQSTAGIEEFRGGRFRSEQAAFRFDVGNDGWRASAGSPDTDVADAVLNKKLFGRKLREHLGSVLARQVRFSLAVEQLPDPGNRVTIDRNYKDALGNPRPVIHYEISDYTKKGMAEAERAMLAMFRHAGIEDRTAADQSARFPFVQYRDRKFFYHGMGHFSGTHTMGRNASDSVVTDYQQSWEHPNLFLTGAGSFVTMGTSNPTLTLAAITIRTAEHLIAGLKAGQWNAAIPTRPGKRQR